MALTLPPNFANDIQGRDTAIVPVVVIGTLIGTPTVQHLRSWFSSSIHISTNQVFYYDYRDDTDDERISVTTKPLLLNIPSLKESIDIEKRNYKISSINLDISNYTYEGKRFSDIIADSVNMVNQPISSLINVECRIYWFSPTTTWVYPEEQGYIGDDYGNRAFQAYVGTIRRYDHDDEKVRLVVEDRSQATLHRDLPLPENYLTGNDVPDKYKNKPIPMVYGHVDRSPCVRYTRNGKWTFQADSIKPSSISGNIADIYNIGNYDQFYLFADESYISIIKENQFLINGDDNTIQLSLPLSSDYTEPIEEILECYYYLIPRNFNIYEGWNTEVATTEQNSLLESVDNAGVFFDNNLSTSHTFNITTNQTDSDDDDLHHWLIQIPAIPEITYIELLSFDVAINGILMPDNFYSRQDTDDDGNQKIIDAGLGGLLAFGTNAYGGDVGGIADTADIIFESSTYDSENLSDYYIKKQLALGNADSSFFIVTTSIHSFAGADFTEISNITIKDVMVRSKISIEKVFQSDFYANVYGRVMSEGISPTAPSVIADILNTELGQDVSPTGDYDWQYAFTVNKKINSKKLIEGIASASPYIPRFNNMGDFKFDVIKETYNDDDLNNVPNSTILNDDVIDYSFSRTKIEDVYTKVEFQYNWDYARNEFNDFNEAFVDVHYDYEYDYYGLKVIDDDPHAESTLVISDDRGKYIRTFGTAKKFAEWMLMWSINQHLIMKVKLPLKYMNLEIGDIIRIGVPVSQGGEGVLGGVKPYGIDYTNIATLGSCNQILYPYFMVTSTNKTLEYCEISAMQMHDLRACEWTFDCFGVCGGLAVIDECGICDGGGGDCVECFDADGSIYSPDCNGDCGGSAHENYGYGTYGCTGEYGFYTCVGGNTGNEQCVFGCLDPVALNYNENANANDYSCEYEYGHATWCFNSECDPAFITNCLTAETSEFTVIESDNVILQEYPQILYYGTSQNYDLIIFRMGYGYPPYDDNPSPEISYEIAQEFYDFMVAPGMGPSADSTIIVDDFCIGSGIDTSEYTVHETAMIMRYNANNLAEDSLELRVTSSSLHLVGNLPHLKYSYTIPDSEDYIPDSYNKIKFRRIAGNTIEGNNDLLWWAGGEDNFRDHLMFDGYRIIIFRPFNTRISEVTITVNNTRPEDYILFPSGNFQGWNDPIINPERHIHTGTFNGEGDYDSFEEHDEGVYYQELGGDSGLDIKYYTIFTLDYGTNPFLQLTEQGKNKVINNDGLNIIFETLVEFKSASDIYTSIQSFAGHTSLHMDWEIWRANCVLKGDLNADGSFNVLDIVTLANCVLGGNCAELDTGCAGDLNSDGVFNVLDIVILANCILAQNCLDLP